jgi:hypothetical protein
MEFVAEFLHVFDGIGRDAEHSDFGFLIIRKSVAKAAGFLGAAGGIGLGIEIENDGLFAFEIGERNRLAGGSRKLE